MAKNLEKTDADIDNDGDIDDIGDDLSDLSVLSADYMTVRSMGKEPMNSSLDSQSEGNHHTPITDTTNPQF